MSLGPSEIFLVVLIILLLFGGKRLPEVARNLGRGIAEIRRYTVDIKRQINTDITEPPSNPVRSTEENSAKTNESSPQVNVNPAAQPRTSSTKPGSTD